MQTHIASTPLSICSSLYLHIFIQRVRELEPSAVFQYTHACLHVAVSHQPCMPGIPTGDNYLTSSECEG